MERPDTPKDYTSLKPPPRHRQWVHDIHDCCAHDHVPFFFKRWGGKTPKAGGRLLDEAEHNAMPGCFDRERSHTLQMAA